MKIVVTGASGFIGGVVALKLQDHGHSVLGIDTAPIPENLVRVFDKFVHRNFWHDHSLSSIQLWGPDAIVHCAGSSLVGPSMQNPAVYYQNNVVGTLTMLDYVRAHVPKCRIMFSSSASVYGNPVMTPCKEVDPAAPISPYGESKHMVEQIMNSYHRAYGLDYIAFRFFNVCGADSQARHGQSSNASHIIAKLLQSVKKGTPFVCNGNNYDTPDGTCIRDYVHVEDIANAHLVALDLQVPAGVYNIGNNQGHSNLEVIQQVREVTGHSIPVEYATQRPGDPDELTANSTKFRDASGWEPKFDLRDTIQHAWNWHKWYSR